jgi:cellulose synthase/poly-beta-1,6-N-acetylglucosamine synthase-like glycosyltransferase
MTVLLGDETLAFAQARGEFFNRDASSFTRAQAMFLDYHFALEQAARSWSGQTLPFNGTCGVWRRAALDLAGGWQGETLTEDWEQSYLIRLQGMRGNFVTSVTAAGELPERLQSWLSQQRRWAKGIGQVAWKMLPRVFESNLAAKERLVVAYPLIQWFLTLSFAAGYLFGIPAMVLLPSIALPLGITLYLAYVLTFAVVLLMMWGGSRAAGRSLDKRLIVDCVPLIYIVLYISWARFWSMPSIMLGRKAIFVRTPKRGTSIS